MTKNSTEKLAATSSAGKQLLAKPIAIFVVAICALLIITAVITNTVFLAKANQAQLTVMANQQAEDYARTIASYIDGHQKDLERLVTQPRIVNLLASQDAAEITKAENEFKSAFADAINLKIIPLGSLGIADPSLSKRQLTTIEIDMIQQAIAGKTVPAEGYRDTGHKIGLIAAYSAENDDVTGVILLSLKIKGLYRLILSIAKNQGEVKLIQAHSKNNILALATIGSAGEHVPAITKTVAHANHWTLEFRPSELLAKDAAIDGGITWTIFTISIVLTIMFGWITYRITSAKLNRDIVNINITLLSWVTGKQKKSPELKIEALQKTLVYSRKLARLRKQDIAGNTEYPAPKKKEELLPIAPPIEPEELEGLPDELRMDLFDYHDPKPAVVPQHIFRAYDIRGLAQNELTKGAAYQIGLALGSEAKELENSDLIVGRDGRVSSPELSDNLIRGIIDSGCNVINLGAVPTPLMYFAIHKLHAINGAMITGSHLSAEYNGVKMVLNHTTLNAESIQKLQQRIAIENFSQGLGDHTDLDITEHYIANVVEDISLSKSLKIVIDCANAIPAIVAPELFSALDCEVIPLYCELDGSFPNHAPNPSEKVNLKTLTDTVKLHNADIGLAFDGDGDRVAAVTSSGKIIPADHLAALFAKDILTKNKNAAVVYDVKSGRYLQNTIIKNGGNAILSPSGHSRIKAAMSKNNAIFGAEYSGHFFFADRWPGFDDGLYAAARLLELITSSDKSLDELIASIPTADSPEEILVPVSEGEQFAIVNAIKDNADWGDALITIIDGLRVDYDEGWGLIRGSNTSANISLRFEAENSKALSDIQTAFRKAIKAARPDLKLPF